MFLYVFFHLVYNVQFAIFHWLLYIYIQKHHSDDAHHLLKKLKPVAMYSDWNNIDNFNNFSESPKGKIT